MDLKTKIQLSREIESYWDLLPWHIASRIVNLKIRQEYLDEVERERRRKLNDQIVKLHKLKVMWGLGSVFCKPMKCQHSYGRIGCEHVRLYGRYIDLEGRPKVAFLAFNFDDAIHRIYHLKSFVDCRTDTPLCYDDRTRYDMLNAVDYFGL